MTLFDDAEMDQYRPRGKCWGVDCEHEATEIWLLYRGPRSYEWRCVCCVAKGKLERAKAARDRIPALELALATAEKECGGEHPLEVTK